MPGRNGRGPMGMGPKSGRGAGYCGGVGAPGYVNAGPGRETGVGTGRGFGFMGRGQGGGRHGWRHFFNATGLPGWMRFGQEAAPNQKPNPELEKQALQNHAQALQSELDAVNQRLSTME
jgi:hypothetical protein